jgi:hypothetical protein
MGETIKKNKKSCALIKNLKYALKYYLNCIKLNNLYL